MLTYLTYHWPYFHLLAATVLSTLPFSGRLGPWLDTGFFRVTANLSFAIYLWHVIVLMALVRHWPALPVSDLTSFVLFGATALALAYAVGALSYYLLERPVLNWAHRWGKRAPVAIAASRR